MSRWPKSPAASPEPAPARHLRRVRRWLLVCVVLFLAWYLSGYEITRLAADNDTLMPFANPRAAVLVRKRDPMFTRGKYVNYVLTIDGNSFAATGRIFAAPGDTLKIQDRAIQTDFGALTLGAADLPRWTALDGHTLAAEEYLVGNANPASRIPDARRSGLVITFQLQSQILLPLD